MKQIRIMRNDIIKNIYQDIFNCKETNIYSTINLEINNINLTLIS